MIQTLLSRRDACKGLVAAAALSGGMDHRGEAASAVPDALEAFEYSGVRLLDGMLKTQTSYVRNLFMRIPEDNLLHGFRARAGLPAPGTSLDGWYGADLFHAFGQYLSGMARLSKALGDAELGEKAKRLAREWAKTIGPKGFFFYSLAPKSPIYTYDKTMCGLVDLYKYAGFKEALPLMSRITGWASANLKRSRGPATRPFNAGEWYTLSENLYRAYEATGESQFRSFGDVWRYPRYWDMFTHNEAPGPFHFHAYSHVNTLSSCAMTYKVTHEQRYLNAAVNAFRWLERTQMFATGGFGPGETLVPADGSLGKSLDANKASFETGCGSWAGFKLGRYLIELTGDSIYGDWIEKLVYNGIGAALPLQPDGSTFYYSDYGVPGGPKGYHKDHWPCCSGTYIQAVADYHNLIYFRGPNKLYVNLFVPSTVTWDHNGNEVELEQKTAYPRTTTTSITVRTRRPDSFAIGFRVPQWCPAASAEVNGVPAAITAVPGSWAAVDRRWSDGDRLQISLPMEHVLRPVDQQHPNRVAFTYGPVVLAGKGHGHVVRRNGRLAHSFIRKGEGLEFDLENVTFVPFHRFGFGEPYQMYFDLLG